MVDSEICTTQTYDYALIIAIYGQKKVLDLRVRVVVLSRSFL